MAQASIEKLKQKLFELESKKTNSTDQSSSQSSSSRQTKPAKPNPPSILKKAPGVLETLAQHGSAIDESSGRLEELEDLVSAKLKEMEEKLEYCVNICQTIEGNPPPPPSSPIASVPSSHEKEPENGSVPQKKRAKVM